MIIISAISNYEVIIVVSSDSTMEAQVLMNLKGPSRKMFRAIYPNLSVGSSCLFQFQDFQKTCIPTAGDPTLYNHERCFQFREARIKSECRHKSVVSQHE